jgi:hypothetical protein
MEPTQPRRQFVPEVLPPGINMRWSKADHSPPCVLEVKNGRTFTSTFIFAFLVWCLIQNRDVFIFTMIEKYAK